MFGLFRLHRAPVATAVPVNHGLKAEPISFGDGVIAGGAYYADRRMIKRAKRSLEKRLSDKTALAMLPEAQRRKVLEGLLDCINIGERMAVNGTWLREYASRILPIITDEQILDYAKRLYISW